MRKEWPFYLAVTGAGVIAGVAIAGLPQDDESLSVTAPSTTIVVIGTVAPADSSIVVTTTVVASSPVVPETTDPSVVDTVPLDTVPLDTLPITATTVATTTVATTTVATTTVATTTTVPATQGLVDRAAVRLVLANGDGRFNLVGRNADRLLALGYVAIDQTDVGDRPDVTTIYYRPGFDDEAEVLAGDLQTPNAQLVPLPDTAVTANDGAGDLIVVLGPDALR